MDKPASHQRIEILGTIVLFVVETTKEREKSVTISFTESLDLLGKDKR
jgi:hypothetical protein